MKRFLFPLFATSLAALAQPVELPKPNYCVGLLRAVPNRPQLPQAEGEEIQRQHLAHLTALGEKGWLRAAGPILTPGELRGILISTCQSVGEANELASRDPAVERGRLSVESYLWTGPPGIGDRYRKERAHNPGAKDSMRKHVLVLLGKGPAWQGWPAKEVFAAHVAYAQSLHKAGSLIAGGPFHDAGEWIGVFVFDGVGLEEARRLVEQDPLVRGGHARLEAYDWMAADGTFPN